mmetsp:Transcript_37410/g.98673  ORF Transcript_37410/g.98673 Transcript_37410/m.98673 type:complete len:257 (+) Transcript_37410:171-941(+)
MLRSVGATGHLASRRVAGSVALGPIVDIAIIDVCGCMRRATCILVVLAQRSPIVRAKHDPLTVFGIRPGRPRPIATIPLLNAWFPQQRVILCRMGDVASFPCVTWISLPSADRIHDHVICFVAVHKRETVISIGQVNVCQVLPLNYGRVGVGVRDDIHLSWFKFCVRRERVPKLVLARLIWFIHGVGVSKAAEISRLVAGVVNLKVLVAAHALGVTTEEQLNARWWLHGSGCGPAASCQHQNCYPDSDWHRARPCF